MIVIGIDPGAANTGFGVVRTINARMVALDGGVIETAPELPAEDRLAKIHESLGQLMEETSSRRWRSRTSSATSSARRWRSASGVAMLAAAQRGIPCFDYTRRRP